MNFKSDTNARQSVRKELELLEEACLIGMVGRFRPQKDHGTFVRADALLHAARPDVYFLLWESK
jgi:hypothetical protein